MERLGKEPNPDNAPLEIYHFPLEVQQSFLLHSVLPDRWDGASGNYFGKDWSIIEALLNIYNIKKDKQIVIYFLKSIDTLYSKQVNEKLEQQRKARERKSQVGEAHIASDNIKNYGKK